jgi:hypothetical protein
VGVRQFIRFGCAGVAVIMIAALTSVGLYAVVAGGLPWNGSVARSSSSGATVLVTIQAGPVTPTVPATLASTTSTPSSLLPFLGVTGPSVAPPSAAPTPAHPRGAPTPAPSSVASATMSAATSPVADASRRADGPLLAAPAEPSRQAAHEGVTLEIVEVDRMWQAIGPDGVPLRPRQGFDLLTVQVKLSNQADEVRYVADTDLLLVAEDGARFAPRQAPPLRGPHLLTLPVPPNDAVRGWLTYDVPTGTDPRRLQWSPTTPDRPRAEKTYMLALPR